MQIIYKYPISAPGFNTLTLYKDYKILKLGYDPNRTLCIWAIVNTEKEKEEVQITLVGTGWPLDFETVNATYIDTINDGPYVWHAFEVKTNEDSL